MTKKPAILGGPPAFGETVPVSKPTMPGFDRVEGSFRNIFSTGMLTTSVRVAEYERRVADYTRVSEAVAVSSNTAGLLLLFRCLGLSGQVILPSFTFSASGHALIWNSLTPMYADIREDTFLIDPESVESALTSDTAAIFGVPLWGNPCDVDRLQEIADARGIPVVYDSAQAIGSRLNGKVLGGFGLAEVFSCSPTKMAPAGEGGLITTNDVDLARDLRKARNYGVEDNYDCHLIGINARLSELHAAVGLATLDMLDGQIVARLELIGRYRAGLSETAGITFQQVTSGGRLNGVYFSIRVDAPTFGMSRDTLATALRQEGIDTRKYYVPLHRQGVYANHGAQFSDRLTATERVSESTLTLPLHTHLDDANIDAICDAVRLVQHYADEISASEHGQQVGCSEGEK